MQEFPALSPDTDTGPIPPPPDTPEILTAPHGFRLEGLLGIGGMGVVYAATQLELRRTVAIKYLRPDLPINLRTRFQAEATTIAALDHPNVLRLYAVGELGGRPYLILELIPDGSLADRLRDGPLAGREAAFLVGGAAAGIAAAHARGIVHRDLKPSNVLLSRTSRGAGTADSNGASRSDSRRPASDFVPKISDFGLAKQTADPAGATVPGRVLGTPSYMAPEQALGATTPARPRMSIRSGPSSMSASPGGRRSGRRPRSRRSTCCGRSIRFRPVNSSRAFRGTWRRSRSSACRRSLRPGTRLPPIWRPSWSGTSRANRSWPARSVGSAARRIGACAIRTARRSRPSDCRSPSSRESRSPSTRHD